MSIIYKKYDLFPDSIIIREFNGKVNVADIIHSWESLIYNKQITSEIKGVINILTACELQMNIDSFHKLMEYLKNKECLKRINWLLYVMIQILLFFLCLQKLKYMN